MRAGLLLVLEVVRPFRDLSVDGPLALIAWGLGAAIALASLFLRGRSRVFGIFGVAVNLIPLIIMLAVLWLLGHSSLAWH